MLCIKIDLWNSKPENTLSYLLIVLPHIELSYLIIIQAACHVILIKQNSSYSELISMSQEIITFLSLAFQPGFAASEFFCKLIHDNVAWCLLS